MRRAAMIMTALWLLMFLLPGPEPQASQAGRSIGLAQYRDRLAGGFVGQMAGVVYGAPFEFRFEGTTVPGWMLPEWKPRMLRGALTQDDIYVELTFLQTLEANGPEVGQEIIGRDFGKSRYPLWHANKAARDNIRAGVMPPLSGHPRYNAHADDIDFQIEADLFGLICPGMPAAARELCWKFGHVMNYGDAVYGGVFMSAMYSAAFFEDDRVRVVEAGLASIPGESMYARTITDVLDAYRADPNDWKRAWRTVEKNWADKVHCPNPHPLYPWRKMGIGANVNGAYVVIGLLYGNGDPISTIRISTMCGRDNDCNPASAMGVLGTMIGLENLPPAFKAGLPKMEGRNFAYTGYDWKQALDAMERQAALILAENGGRVEGKAGSEVWLIPLQSPDSLPLEQWPYDVPAADVPLP